MERQSVTNERLVHRSLGVPDIIEDTAKREAGARRLAELAGLDVTIDPNVSHQSQVRLDDARNV
jgi:hypothetical protein